MTDAPSHSIDDSLAELVETFDLLDDWESRIGYVIDLGKDLKPLAEADRIEGHKVPGCAAQVGWRSNAATAACGSRRTPTAPSPRATSPCCSASIRAALRPRSWPSTPAPRSIAWAWNRP